MRAELNLTDTATIRVAVRTAEPVGGQWRIAYCPTGALGDTAGEKAAIGEQLPGGCRGEVIVLDAVPGFPAGCATRSNATAAHHDTVGSPHSHCEHAFRPIPLRSSFDPTTAGPVFTALATTSGLEIEALDSDEWICRCGNRADLRALRCAPTREGDRLRQAEMGASNAGVRLLLSRAGTAAGETLYSSEDLVNNHISDTHATMGRAPEPGAVGPGHPNSSVDLSQTSPDQGAAAERECGWRCGDRAPGHGHFTVIVRETTGKLLGRLGGDGTTTHRRVHAAVLSRARAEYLAKDIMARHQDLTATVRPF